MEIKHSDLMGTFEQKMSVIDQFNLMDDDFFAVVMTDKKACSYMLSVLLGQEITVIESRPQYAIRNLVTHSVVLDVLAQDTDGSLFSVEVQVRDDDVHPKRVRYDQAAIDWSALEKGKDYKELPKLYLLFISKFDMWGLGKAKYEVVRTIKGTDIEADNGVSEMYFYTRTKETGELTEMLHYFNKSDAEDKRFGALSEAVRYIKREREGVDSMSEAVERYAEQRAHERALLAVIMNKVETVQNMLKRNIALSDALEMTALDEPTYRKYLDHSELGKSN